MPRTSSGNVSYAFRKKLLLSQKSIWDYDKMRFRWETLVRKNLEKLQPNGRPKC